MYDKHTIAIRCWYINKVLRQTIAMLLYVTAVDGCSFSTIIYHSPPIIKPPMQISAKNKLTPQTTTGRPYYSNHFQQLYETIYLADTTPGRPTVFGNGSFACVELDSAEAVQAAYEVLKEGGKVFCEAQETFWNKCYAEFEDKFGLKWTIMIEEEIAL